MTSAEIYKLVFSSGAADSHWWLLGSQSPAIVPATTLTDKVDLMRSEQTVKLQNRVSCFFKCQSVYGFVWLWFEKGES